jgi:site-specific DNA-adenine methylase
VSEIKVEFNITGDNFPHEEITKILKIVPTDAYYKNEVFFGGPNKDIPMNKKECCWSIETEYTESIDVTAEIQKIYDIIKDKKTELIEISERFSVSYFFMIVIYYGDNPIMSIKKELIKFASDINAEFYFDTYV